MLPITSSSLLTMFNQAIHHLIRFDDTRVTIYDDIVCFYNLWFGR